MLNNILRTAFMVVVSVTVFAAATAFAASSCRNGKFPGTYTRVDAPSDVFGDGSVIHQFVYQLTLSADGTASQNWTGLQDFALNSGTGSTNIGSWVCRSDGNLVVTWVSASYDPEPPGPNHPLSDVSLLGYSRVTVLFRVDDDNTLTRIQARGRNYGPADDPTNATGGTLGPLAMRQFTYRRMVASDADLLLP